MHCPLQLWDEFLLQVELTLNMLRFSWRNPNKSANQEVYGSFDFNKTPLAPLGTKALIYDDPASRASLAPHATDGFYVGPASNHYQCLRFYIPSTQRFCFSNTWRLYPTNCQIPVTLQHDLSIAAAADIVQSLGGTVPTTTTAKIKIKHIRAIQKMTAIMAGQRAPAMPPAQRVVKLIPRMATTSINITAPNIIRNMPRIHQRQTCNNNPFHILANNDDDLDTVVASNCTPRIPPPSLPTSDLEGNPPMRRPICQPMKQPTSLPPTFQAGSPPITPPPRVLAIPSIVQAITPTAPNTQIHDLCPNTSRKPSKPPAGNKQPTRSLPIVEPDDKRDDATTRLPAPPRRSIQLINTQTPCQISCQALFHLIDIGLNKAPMNTIPQSLSKYHQQYTGPLIDIKEYCYGVVHPVTKKTITHYRNLIKDPLLKDLWIKAMSKELHRLAQGCPGVTKGTNNIVYLSHSDICKIPQDRTVTYARIVIDHRPQKEDSHRVRITVGGNLIDYPFELTTRTADMVSSKILWNSVISTKDARFAGANI